MTRKFTEAKKTGRREVVLWGDGSPTREFLHVRDAARAIALVTERYDDAEPVNIGTGFEIAIRDLADKVARLAGYTDGIRWDPSRPGASGGGAWILPRRVSVSGSWQRRGWRRDSARPSTGGTALGA